ncbi:hypothetical protein P168DRAFT_290683 [Aspergillus campestris IBT 28561]|uniref:Uncharacterized protein n=1 Tax=Aspergillus campestris (strain IBT 28561) TaxID=1392248 RepID=A0A2I1D0W8_ASPC2|nr:uncharacterized protein P168DRAFT_290683 [Aspergillus campestris IBT 28561]PKY03521.1 hypothetical protein P168DRAFT_290683 [Aspergillus campestris IBT 28561]
MDTAKQYARSAQQKAQEKTGMDMGAPHPHEPDVNKLNPEEYFETTVDKDGHIVDDRYAFTDGENIGKGRRDEADAYEAATKDFE